MHALGRLLRLPNFLRPPGWLRALASRHDPVAVRLARELPWTYAQALAVLEEARKHTVTGEAAEELVRSHARILIAGGGDILDVLAFLQERRARLSSRLGRAEVRSIRAALANAAYIDRRLEGGLQGVTPSARLRLSEAAVDRYIRSHPPGSAGRKLGANIARAEADEVLRILTDGPARMRGR